MTPFFWPWLVALAIAALARQAAWRGRRELLALARPRSGPRRALRARALALAARGGARRVRARSGARERPSGSPAKAPTS